MDFEKIKQKLASLDPNAAIATIVSTLGSMNTEGFITIGYFLVSSITALVTLKGMIGRTKRDDEMRIQEVRLKEAEVEAAILLNKIKAKELENAKP